MTAKFTRKVNRLPLAEIYQSNNSFFVTICVQDRVCIFVEREWSIQNLQLSFAGKIVEKTWQDLPNIFENVVLDEFVIMPNHIHFIISFLDIPIRKLNKKETNLSEIISYFKAFSQKTIREKLVEEGLSLHSKNGGGGDKNGDIKSPLHGFNYHKIWQKSFYDHIIRNSLSLQKIQKYIQNNPQNWELDLLNPINNDKFQAFQIDKNSKFTKK